MERILTFNCHEGYVHLLGKLGIPMDIIDGLPGRYATRWDERMRPVPERARLMRLEEALGKPRYDVAIAHNLTDLVALRALDVPKILVLHVSLDARMREEPGGPDRAALHQQLRDYLKAIGAVAVAVSNTKAESWGQGGCTVIRPCADPDEYGGYEGTEPVALRVANQVMQRAERFGWAAHEAITQGHPLCLVGHNPTLPGVEPASSWADLRERYRRHRVYVHTAGIGLDDGYNLGVVEAMMTGMPVVSLSGSESPIVDGENGYVSADTGYLNTRLGALLEDRDLALELGRRAREKALATFSLTGFVSGWHSALELAFHTFERNGS